MFFRTPDFNPNPAAFGAAFTGQSAKLTLAAPEDACY